MFSPLHYGELSFITKYHSSEAQVLTCINRTADISLC
jgi:hypothetical protein